MYVITSCTKGVAQIGDGNSQMDIRPHSSMADLRISVRQRRPYLSAYGEGETTPTECTDSTCIICIIATGTARIWSVC